MKKLVTHVSDYLRRTDLMLYFLCLVASGMSVLLLVAMANSGYIDTDAEGLPYKTALVQVFGTTAGFVGAVVMSQIDYHTLAKLWKLHLPLCILVVLLTFTSLGQGVGDADDVAWLSFFGGFMSLQPTELLKVSFIITFALHLSSVGNEINLPRNTLLLGLHAGGLIFLVHLQGDDGTALIFLFIFLCMMFIAGWSLWYFAAGIALTAAAAPIAWLYVMNDAQRGRILALYGLGPEVENTMYQQNRALLAIGSGQMLGTGLFSGKHSYVPVMSSDFIFPFIGEALGFVGCLLAVLLLVCICLRVIWTSHVAHDLMGRYMCVGVFAMIAFQAIINIGMNLSLLPVVGVTLPLFSKGGTSVLAVYLGIGLVISVYMHSRRNLFLDR